MDLRDALSADPGAASDCAGNSVAHPRLVAGAVAGIVCYFTTRKLQDAHPTGFRQLVLGCGWTREEFSRSRFDIIGSTLMKQPW
jgi:hypothetical protein